MPHLNKRELKKKIIICRELICFKFKPNIWWRTTTIPNLKRFDFDKFFLFLSVIFS